MVNNIINSISKSLHKTYDLVIYIDEVPQNFKSSCFYIKLIDYRQKRIIDERYRSDLRLSIQYIVDENNRSNRHIYGMITKLDHMLELITLDNEEIVRGTDKKVSVENRNLTYLISFSWFSYNYEEKENMENLTYRGDVING